MVCFHLLPNDAKAAELISTELFGGVGNRSGKLNKCVVLFGLGGGMCSPEGHLS